MILGICGTQDYFDSHFLIENKSAKGYLLREDIL